MGKPFSPGEWVWFLFGLSMFAATIYNYFAEPQVRDGSTILLVLIAAAMALYFLGWRQPRAPKTKRPVAPVTGRGQLTDEQMQRLRPSA